MPTTYAARHALRDPWDDEANALDLDHPQERYQLDELTEVLRAMPLDPDRLGDGGPSDWTLSVLFALAGAGDEDATAYLLPRVQHAARTILGEIGYPGPAFEGA